MRRKRKEKRRSSSFPTTSEKRARSETSLPQRSCVIESEKGVRMTADAGKSDYKSIKSNDVCICDRMKSFRVSKILDELIKTECEKRHTHFSSFMRDAALDAMCNSMRDKRNISDKKAEVEESDLYFILDDDTLNRMGVKRRTVRLCQGGRACISQQIGDTDRSDQNSLLPQYDCRCSQ